MQYELHAAGFVEEAFDHKRGLGRHDAEHAFAFGDEVDCLLSSFPCEDRSPESTSEVVRLRLRLRRDSPTFAI
jgi:hypothetical protein